MDAANNIFSVADIKFCHSPKIAQIVFNTIMYLNIAGLPPRKSFGSNCGNIKEPPFLESRKSLWIYLCKEE